MAGLAVLDHQIAHVAEDAADRGPEAVNDAKGPLFAHL
jgi:hypothetical protein